MSRNALTRRGFLKVAGFASAALALPPGCTASGDKANPTGKKPNIVFILIDDLGWKDVGFMGSKFYETPNIDRLSRQGMVFTNAYANAPNCAPTRACLMSGQYGPRHGIYTVGSSARGKSHQRKIIPTENNTTLDPKIPTIADALRPAGYISASMGKWHLGADPEAGPIGQGFDVNIGGNEAGHPKSYFSPYKNDDLPDGPDGEYLTDRLTDEAIAFIEANHSRPFFLYLPHYAVHTPLQAKKDMIAKYQNKPPHNGQDNAKYAAMIESTDQGVGRIMKTLDELNLTENTVVVFFSDNGGHGGVTSMKPLRGSKGMLYEGGIREPMIVRWPAMIKSGTTCETPVISIDFYPTFLEITGAGKPAGHTLDGVSIMDLLTQRGKPDRDTLYWHFPAYLEGYTAQHGPFRTTPAGAVRKGDWKLIEYFEDGTLELYNLKDDIGETNDLAKQNPDKTRELHQLMAQWRKKTNAPVPTERNPEYNPNLETKKKK